MSPSEATETQEPGGPHVPEPPSSVALPLPPPVSSADAAATVGPGPRALPHLGQLSLLWLLLPDP